MHEDTVQLLSEFEKKGYLGEQIRCFYLSDCSDLEFESHYHDFHKIMIFLQGDVEYTIEGKSYLLEPNDVVIVNRNEIHKLKIDKGKIYERIIFYIDPGFLEKYTTNEYNLMECMDKAGKEHLNVIRISNFRQSRISKTVSEMKCSLDMENTSGDPDCRRHTFAHPLYLEILFVEFMILLNREVLGEHTEYVITDICNEKVIEIMNYINHNLQLDLSIEELSKKFFMSKYHMMRVFKQETGYTIGNYITNKRLFQARELILQGCSVMDACFESGFKDHSTFSRAYKKVFLESPVKAKIKK